MHALETKRSKEQIHRESLQYGLKTIYKRHWGYWGNSLMDHQMISLYSNDVKMNALSILGM